MFPALNYVSTFSGKLLQQERLAALHLTVQIETQGKHGFPKEPLIKSVLP